MTSETHFSNMLKMLIDESKITRNELVRACEIDRSSFYQFLKGKRVPTKKQYNRLVNALQLSRIEQNELDQYFERAFLGECTWENREKVHKCIRTLSYSENQFFGQYQTFYTDAVLQNESQHYEGKADVLQLLQGFLVSAYACDIPSFDLFMPSENDAFFEIMKHHFYKCGKKEVKIRQLMQFPVGKEISGSVLDSFNDSLYFFSRGCDGFEIFYYYAAAWMKNCIGVFYPYFIMDSKRIILVNAEFDKAVLSVDSSIVEAYKESFQKAITASKEMVKKHASVDEAIRIYEELAETKNTILYYSNMPCFAQMATEEWIMKYMDPGCQQLFNEHCAKIRENENMIEFFSLTGFGQFMKDGIVDELPSGYVKVIEPEDRIKVRDFIIDHLNKKIFLIDETKIPDVDSWALFIAEGEKIIMQRKKIETFYNIDISERNIVDAFSECLGSLPSGKYVLPKDEAEKMLLNQ